MSWSREHRVFMDWLYNIAGAMLHAVGVWWFIEPCRIAPGGASGIALLINHLSGLPVGTQTIDAILYGMNRGTMVMVSSKHNQEIADDIMTQLGRGTTFFKSVGGYSRKDMEMLMCVVERKQFYSVKRIPDKWDRAAFVIASETKEVYGEGFLNDPRYEKTES